MKSKHLLLILTFIFLICSCSPRTETAADSTATSIDSPVFIDSDTSVVDSTGYPTNDIVYTCKNHNPAHSCKADEMNDRTKSGCSF